MDEIELSGVGLPSSATTDSNNSNDTAGSPISMASGTSPIASPSMIGCINHNHSSDCHENDCHEKRKREDVPILSKITVNILNCYYVFILIRSLDIFFFNLD